MPTPLVPATTWTRPIAPPPLAGHPPRIRALIRKLHTPELVQRWIFSLRYNPQETMRGLRGVLNSGAAHCLEAALAAATILEYHGYPPLILDLESADKIDHTLFLFRRNGKYGTVGMSKDFGLRGRKAAYPSIRSLAHSYAAPYIDHKATLTGYGVLDLRNLAHRTWRTDTGNLWYVERALLSFPHRRLRLSSAYIRKWRLAYTAFRRRFPGRQPEYYPRQDHWLDRPPELGSAA